MEEIRWMEVIGTVHGESGEYTVFFLNDKEDRVLIA